MPFSSTGVITTGLAVKHSLWLTVITLGVGHGLAFSFAYAQAIEAAMRVINRF